MSRSTWTPLQIALADYMSADSAHATATQDLMLAELDLATLTDDHQKGWIDRREVERAQQVRDAATQQVETSAAQLTSARAAYWAVNRLTRKQFADLLGIAPDTLSGYVTRQQAPAPDSPAGERPWWYEATAQAYAARVKQPGRRAGLG